MKNKISIIMIFIISLLGCDNNTVINEFTTLENFQRSYDFIESLIENPTAENPIIGISNKELLNIPVRKKISYGIKYYNNEEESLNDAEIKITNCKSTKKIIDIEDPLIITSGKVNIESHSFKGIPFTIKNNNLNGSQAYICTLEIWAMVTTESVATNKFSKSFIIKVIE